MKTPFGKECSYYYEDFNRGREIQRCDLLVSAGQGAEWQTSLCGKCPVPRIQQANSCKNLLMQGSVKRAWLGFSREMQVSCTCIKSLRDVPEPEVGCGECHADNPLIQALFGKTE